MPTQEKRLSQKYQRFRNVEPPTQQSMSHTNAFQETKETIFLGLGLGLVQHPSEQVDLGNDGQWLHRTTCILLGHNRSAVPLEEAV